MAKKINIAELLIDDKALLKSSQEIKKELDELKKTNRELKKAGLESSKVFIQNSADIKILSKAYNENIKTINQRQQAQVDANARQEQLNVALNIEANTIEGLREQNKLLNKLRNQTNILTEDGRKELEMLNAKLDENNNKIKENVDQYTQQKINIGNYKDSIKEAFEELNIFNGGFAEFIARSKDAGGVGPMVTNSLKGMTQGVIGLTKATLAFIATPIGAVLTVIVGAIALVSNAFNRSEASMNKVRKAISPLTGLFNKLLGALEPVGEFLIDGIVSAFELVEKGILSTMKSIESGLRFLGLESAADSLNSFTESVAQTAESSRELADAEALLAENQRKTRLVQLEYLRDAEKLRQIRDNENLSIKERTQANEELGAVLKKQIAEELALAEQALALTDLRIKAEGETSALLDERAERLIEIADIQERITGQESEQLVNRVSLQKEAVDKAKEMQDKIREQAQERISQLEDEISLFISQQGFRENSLEDELSIQQKVADKRSEILRQQLDNDLITQTQYDTALLEMQNELLARKSEILLQNAENELQIFENENRDRLTNEQFFTEQLLQEELNRQERLADKRREFARIQFEEGVINQQQYNARINEIDEENRLRKEEAQRKRQFQEQEQRLINLELRREAEQLTFEEDLAIGLEMLEMERKQAIANAESTGADISLINKKYARIEQDLRKSVELAKVDLVSKGLGQIKGFFDESTGIYKAFAIAQATMDTYASANLALKTYPPPAGPIFAGISIAQGLANVARIGGVQFEDGGIITTGDFQRIKGPSHAGGGVPIYAGNQYVGEAEGNEGIGILNRSAFSDFMRYNNSFISGKSANGQFTGGGIITQTVRTPNNNADVIAGFEQALASMPPPIAIVEDIDRGLNNKILIESGANT